ncbi:MAG: hypothetical protein RJA20_2170 [Bacteroidota bacterium]|jgi:hypothetical protein
MAIIETCQWTIPVLSLDIIRQPEFGWSVL